MSKMILVSMSKIRRLVSNISSISFKVIKIFQIWMWFKIKINVSFLSDLFYLYLDSKRQSINN